MRNLVEMKNISKSFLDIKALNQVDFTLQQGQIHALLGENGAGKSTLMKILAGMYHQETGQIFMDGIPVEMNNPRKALSLGINMVYQNFTLSPELSVQENILLGNKLPFYLDSKKINSKIHSIIDPYGFKIDLNAKVWQLSVGEQQRVEIIKCFYRNAKILILDEPTAILTPPEVKELFLLIRRYRDSGGTVVFISHKLKEVLDISDYITVFRKGNVIGELPTAQANEKILSQMVIGRDVDLTKVNRIGSIGNTLLNIKNIVVKNSKGLEAVKDVSLNVCSGEIVGIAAISGNGQNELSESITGMKKLEKGSISINNHLLKGLSKRQIMDLGVSSITEKRLDCSLIPNFSISQNLIIKSYNDRCFKRGIFLDQRSIRQHANKLVKEYDISTTNIDKPVRLLSGGNLQKVVLAREINRDPKLIVAVNPTYGLDIGAIEYIQEQIISQRNKGCGVLLISDELDEIIRLSDRILVMCQGKIVGEFLHDEFNREKIGYLMTGGGV